MKLDYGDVFKIPVAQSKRHRENMNKFLNHMLAFCSLGDNQILEKLQFLMLLIGHMGEFNMGV